MTLDENQSKSPEHTGYSETAYRPDRVPVMPPPVQTQYENTTPHCPRLPWGNYQYIAPLLALQTQLAYAKAHDGQDSVEGHPWDHRRIQDSTGFLAVTISSLFLLKMSAYVLIWTTGIVSLFIFLVSFFSGNLETAEDWIETTLAAGVLFGGSALAYVIFSPLYAFTCRFSEKHLRADPTGYYRSDGMVRIRQKDGVFEAPFYEFDAYLEKVPFRGSLDYKLLLQHRYEPVSIRASSGLLGNTGRREEVIAFWDLLQRFMDITQPLPDVPMFEPFRHLDPVTVEHDRATGRNPRYWRDMSEEEWRQNHEPQEQQRLQMARTDGPCIISEKVQGRVMPVSDVQENPDGGSLFRA